MAKLITSIYKLKYAAFKEMMFEGSLSLLVEEGEVSQDELNNTWNDILAQYSEAMGSDGNDLNYYSTVRDYLWLKRKYEKTCDYIYILKIIFVPEWMKQLLKVVQKTLPADHVIDPKNIDEYFTLLNDCEQRAKGLRINLDIAEISLQAELKKREQNSEIGKPTYESFQRIEINLDLHFSMNVDYNSISVFKFCELCKRYVADSKNPKRAVK